MTRKAFTVLAHRGARGHAPENTLPAFDKAVALGAKWLELDVQLHDGALWVFHDQRLTDEQQQILTLRFGEGLRATVIAAALGKTEEAVRALQHRALATLRKLMAAGEE